MNVITSQLFFIVGTNDREMRIQKKKKEKKGIQKE